MIEALVRYIEKRGYQVEVSHQRLLIYKIIEEQELYFSWWLTQLDLKYFHKDVLFTIADCHIYELEQAERNMYGYVH